MSSATFPIRLGSLLAAFALTGCGISAPWKRPEPTVPVDGLVLTGATANEQDPSPAKKSGEMAAAHDSFRKGDYDKAQSAFGDIADDTRNSPAVAEEARYYEAECLRMRERLPKACDTYHKMLIDFPAGAFREQACKRMYDIALEWLKPSFQEMEEYREKQAGQRTVVLPAMFSLDKRHPMLDGEGRALQALEQVHYSDITGPLGAEALFLCGYVKWYREEYKEADHYFSQLVEMHRDHPKAQQALEYAVICKNLSTGGSDYDGRKAAESRQMLDNAFKLYPQMARDEEKKEFVMRQMVAVNLQQAEADYKMGEFYQRTGHPGSAYFYFDLVIRRYPGTSYAKQAQSHMQELDVERKKEQAGERSTFGRMMDDARQSWNRMWGLETKLDLVTQELGGPVQTPTGQPLPVAGTPAAPLPASMLPGGRN